MKNIIDKELEKIYNSQQSEENNQIDNLEGSEKISLKEEFKSSVRSVFKRMFYLFLIIVVIYLIILGMIYLLT